MRPHGMNLITSLTEGILIIFMAAQSWKGAKEIAEREEEELVFHNYDTGEYGACSRDRSFGCFVKGEFIEQRCICIPAKYSPEELEKKERDFLSENPEWAD
jgi:hypothetical protein